ncbi:MAG: NPCBM/NEW2 domain-containing protein [Candidatus Omnitrophota bacterium]
MAGKAHRLITRQALKTLPGWEQHVWEKETDNIIDEYCFYPDSYYDPDWTRRVLPYLFFLKNIPFHYLPGNSVEYNYWSVILKGKRYGLKKLSEQPNTNWEFAKKGFRYYFQKIAETLKKNKIEEAAKFAGVFIHVLEDAAACLHCLEGPDGADIFVLDRFFLPPEKMKYLTPGMVMAEPDDADFDLRGYRPKLLGTSILEAVFNLYQRYCEVITHNRLRMVPIVLHTFSGRRNQANSMRSEVNKTSAQIVADALHTASCIAFSRFEKQQVKYLKKIHLNSLKPVSFPRHLSIPYRFTPIIRNCCLDNNRRPVPLRLKLKRGGKVQVVVFAEGMGTGCHAEYRIVYELPANVYTRFKCAVGLHSELGRGGKIQVQVKICGKRVFKQIFSDKYPAERVEVSALSGGLLELAVKDKTGKWANPKNNIVWGDPLLIRNPYAPSGKEGR